jgi:hypothetical protein
VLKETFSADGYIESTVPTSTLNWPFGVAVDGSGNVYIPDTYNHRVLKETLSAGTYTESVVPTSPLSDPFGIAVDGSGNVYISDSYEHRVLKETLSAGSYTEATLPTSGLSGPYGCGGPGSSDSFRRFLSGKLCFLFGRRWFWRAVEVDLAGDVAIDRQNHFIAF